MPSISDDPPEYVIAEAIADAINAATFTGPITALSAVVDEIAEPENLDNPANSAPRVYVVPGPELDIALAETRGGDLHEIVVLVILIKRLSSDAERKTLAKLRTQLQNRLRIDREVAGCLIASVPVYWDLREINVQSTFSREGLRGPRVYSGGLQLKFSAMLSRAVS